MKASPEFLSILDNTPRAFLPTGVQQPRQLLRDLLANRPIQLKNGDILQPPSVAEIGRKIVILGDTCDASGMAGLAQDASLLVHESTNAYIPPHIDPKSSKQTPESVQEKALAYGHSTPAMAGDFARRINAQRLFLNHLSAKLVNTPSLVHTFSNVHTGFNLLYPINQGRATKSERRSCRKSKDKHPKLGVEDELFARATY